jgi:hypothetical protein
MPADWLNKQMSDAPGAAPVVEDPEKPQMSDEPPPPREMASKLSMMPDEPSVPTGKTGRMEPVPEQQGQPRRQQLPLDDQSEPPAGSGAAADDERYLRIRLRVEPDGLSIQHIKSVEGPLVAHEDLYGEMAYEVTVEGRRVASASVADAGMNRAFPHPDPVPGQEGHFFAPAPFHDVLVRVPSSAISLDELPRVDIALYRIKEGPLPQALGSKPLNEHFGRELREVGRVKGIDIDQLPEEVRAEALRAFR